jgi:hypothetical protein
VRPDGSVHLVWYLLSAAAGEPAGSPFGAATTAVYQSSSIDAGRTFSAPRVVATHAGSGLTGLPTFAVDREGRMLFVWGQADELPDPADRPLRQARHRLVGIRSDDGFSWSAPYELAPWVPPGTHAGLPALACDGRSWWLIAYLSDDEMTDVVFLRSDDGGATFALDRTLAQRSIPLELIRLWGSALMLYVGDVAHVGDYIGIAATADRVAAVFILPEDDVPTSTATAYVAIADLP